MVAPPPSKRSGGMAPDKFLHWSFVFSRAEPFGTGSIRRS
jgi:hypothetical protein